jgi:hypothetical protein
MARPKSLSEEQRDYHSRAVALAERTRPDLNKLKKVKVDERTTIYISPEKDTDKAVAEWRERKHYFEEIDRKRNSMRQSN